jgi:uroporphyrinogen-III synthase
LTVAARPRFFFLASGVSVQGLFRFEIPSRHRRPGSVTSLAGKTILITRAAHQAPEFVQLVRNHGGIAVEFPTIEILPPASWERLDRALDGLYMYDGLIFTSANGAEFFFRRMEERHDAIQDLRPKMIFAVGEKTKQAIERRELTVRAVPEKFTSFDLQKMLEHEDLNGKAFLFPRGNMGNDQLEGNLKILGAHVDPVVVYRTVQPQRENVDTLRANLLDGSIDAVTFTSASTFQNFQALFTGDRLKDILGRTSIAVIGPATASAVEDAGLDVDIVAKQPTIESLVDSMSAYF